MTHQVRKSKSNQFDFLSYCVHRDQSHRANAASTDARAAVRPGKSVEAGGYMFAQCAVPEIKTEVMSFLSWA